MTILNFMKKKDGLKVEKLSFEMIFGSVGERSNPADCKSAATCFEGSNPSASTKKDIV